jgi:hypothetical protein
MSGSAGSEGSLSRSVDGRYVTLAGYAAPVGMLGPGVSMSIATTFSSSTNRIVGRISADGTVDTSTRLNAAFDQNNVRGATSTNGTDLWVTGAGSPTGGLHHTTLGASGPSANLIGAGVQPTSTRVVQIFGGDLYATGSGNGFPNVFRVGSGTPTTGTQTTTVLPGMPTAGSPTPSPYSYVFFDTDGTAGFDTLYVADDRSIANGGGIQKWVLGTNADSGAPAWTLATTFNNSLTTGVRGLAGLQTSSGITLVATTADSGTVPNTILYYELTGGSGSNPAPTAVPWTSPFNAAADGGTGPATALFRGVALAP